MLAAAVLTGLLVPAHEHNAQDPIAHLAFFEMEVVSVLEAIPGVDRVCTARADDDPTATVVTFFSQGQRYGLGIRADTLESRAEDPCGCRAMLRVVEESVRMTMNPLV
jgi:hypothetical protein